MNMATRTIEKQSSPPASAWDRVHRHLEDERYRIVREIGHYPTPIPACDQHFNHLLAERERVNEELSRLEEAEKRSTGAANSPGAIDKFVRSSPWIRPDQANKLLK